MTKPITNLLPDGTLRPIMTGEMIAGAQKLDVAEWIEENVDPATTRGRAMLVLHDNMSEIPGVEVVVKEMPTQVATFRDRIDDPWHSYTTYHPGDARTRIRRGAIDEISADEWKPHGDQS